MTLSSLNEKVKLYFQLYFGQKTSTRWPKKKFNRKQTGPQNYIKKTDNRPSYPFNMCWILHKKHKSVKLN